MMPSNICPAPAPPPAPTELDELQLRVARRADELARRRAGSGESDRALWLRAEYEVFARAECAGPHGHAVAPPPDGYRDACYPD